MANDSTDIINDNIIRCIHQGGVIDGLTIQADDANSIDAGENSMIVFSSDTTINDSKTLILEFKNNVQVKADTSGSELVTNSTANDFTELSNTAAAGGDAGKKLIITATGTGNAIIKAGSFIFLNGTSATIMVIKAGIFTSSGTISITSVA